MRSSVDEMKADNGTEVRAGLLGYAPEDVAKRIEKGVNQAKAAVSEKLEDSKMAAERMLKKGRYAVEDCMTETTHQIKRYPLGSVAIAFAAGAALGLLVPRFSRR